MSRPDNQSYASKRSVRWLFALLVVALSLIAALLWRDTTARYNTSQSAHISLRQAAGNIQYRYPGSDWHTITTVAALTGHDGKDGIQGIQGDKGEKGDAGDPGVGGANGGNGQDGRAIELQATVLYIQWRYTGEPTWRNLIALAELKGDKGDKGDTGDIGAIGATGATGPQGPAGKDYSPSCDDLSGYIWVPGSAKYGTLPGFCVMKYEAKDDGSGNAVSTMTGSPWASISQRTARDKARAACAGCHLISENEWLTIAENVLFQNSNWTSGTVGTGVLFSGHNDSTPPATLAASTDNNGYYGEVNIGGNQRRTLTLSNGQVIWDLAGNVYEWTDATVNAQESPSDGTLPDANGKWIQYTAITSYKGLNYLRPPVDNWNSSQGIGQLYTDEGDTGVRGFIRGGGYSTGSLNTGIFAVYLANTPTSSIANIGFRVAR